MRETVFGKEERSSRARKKRGCDKISYVGRYVVKVVKRAWTRREGGKGR